MIDTANKAGEGGISIREKGTPADACPPLGTHQRATKSRSGLPNGILYSPGEFFLTGVPFITETPRQGALGGLTPYKMNQQLAAAM